MRLFLLIFLSTLTAFTQNKPNPAPSPSTAAPAPATKPQNTSVPEFEKREIPASEISEVVIVSGGGTLKISSTSSTNINIYVSKPKAGTRCELQILTTPEQKLMIQAFSRASNACYMDGEISIPDGIALKGTFESGNVRISNIKMLPEVSMGSGDLALENIEIPGTIKIRRGSLVLDRWKAPNSIVVQDNANVRVNYSVIPGFGKLEIESKSGNVDVTLPKSQKNANGDIIASDFEVKYRLDAGEIQLKRN